jgi:hypothetical protein
MLIGGFAVTRHRSKRITLPDLRTLSATGFPAIEEIADTGCQHSKTDDREQDEKQGISTPHVEQDEPEAEDYSDGERGLVEIRDLIADDLNDKHPEAKKEKTGQPR